MVVLPVTVSHYTPSATVPHNIFVFDVERAVFRKYSAVSVPTQKETLFICSRRVHVCLPACTMRKLVPPLSLRFLEIRNARTDSGEIFAIKTIKKSKVRVLDTEKNVTAINVMVYKKPMYIYLYKYVHARRVCRALCEPRMYDPRECTDQSASLRRNESRHMLSLMCHVSCSSSLLSVK